MVEQRAVLKDVLLSSGAGSSPATATNIQAWMRTLFLYIIKSLDLSLASRDDWQGFLIQH